MKTPTTDQATRLRSRVDGTRRRTRIITVTSGKGGVGKTSIVANVGLELAKSGASVLLLDGDLGLANLSILFNLAPKADLEDVLEDRCRLSDIVLEVNPRLKLIPAASGAAALAELPEERRQALIGEVEALGHGNDFLLIDTGAGISSTVLALIGMAEHTFVVTTQEPTALSDAYAIIKAARARGTSRLDVIVNLALSHVAARDTHGRLARLTERFLGFTPPLAAVVPRDEAVGTAILRQQPLSIVYPYSTATRAVAALARLLNDDKVGPRHERTHISLAVPDRR
jgi:flagellar biosynthesis protein FlhG